MPQNTTIILTKSQWTLLTNTDIGGGVTFQNQSAYSISVVATGTVAAPTSADGALTYLPMSGELSDISLSTLFPGVAGANRLWAFCDIDVKVMVSHA